MANPDALALFIEEDTKGRHATKPGSPSYTPQDKASLSQTKPIFLGRKTVAKRSGSVNSS
jgi:hypothetical protein